MLFFFLYSVYGVGITCLLEHVTCSFAVVAIYFAAKNGASCLQGICSRECFPIDMVSFAEVQSEPSILGLTTP